MRIGVTEKGHLTLLGRQEGPVQFYAGERLVAHSQASERLPPLRVFGAHRAAIERFGLTAVFPDVAPVPVDLEEFSEYYYGPDDLLKKMYEMVGPGKWDVYKILIRRTEVEMEGVVVLPQSLENARFRVLCEGMEPERIAYMDDPRGGLGHWFMPDNSVLGFHAVYQLDAIPDFLRFTLVFEDDGQNEEARQYRPLYRRSSIDPVARLPDQERIARVAGSRSNATVFLNGGKTAFERLKELARENGIPVGESSISALDWGVGCGRVARFFAEVDTVSLAGADIDADNVEWCSENLLGDYRTVPLMPPTSFGSGEFDLIYSCSVLSHLTEEAADAWLAEMARLLAPGGIALLSYHGSANLVSNLGSRPLQLKDAIERGMFDGDTSQDLKGFIASNEYYRQTFATDEWWTDMFQRHFHLVDIARAAVSGRQDVAVLRRRT